jgi:hypothetical protein
MDAAGHHAAANLSSHRNRVSGHTENEVDGPVDRVDEPTHPTATGRRLPFLAEDSVVGAACGDPRKQPLLDLAIDRSHHVRWCAFGIYLEGPATRPDELARSGRQFDGNFE